jgi:serine/threonine protein kinase
MHGIKPRPILHRDIRWPNIVEYYDGYRKFILIDFDYATFGTEKGGTVKKALKELSETGHAPETLVGKHNKKVDMWGVGYLINSCNISNKPKELTELASKLCANNPKKRPSASEALDEVIGLYKEVIILQLFVFFLFVINLTKF